MGSAQTVLLLDYVIPLVAITGCCGGTSIRDSMTGRHERHVMGECWDLLVGFMGIMSEKSVSCYRM